MKLRAFAKINVSLSVLGLRPDGYHELRTVFQSLELHDTLEFAACHGRVAIECDMEGVPLDERNLVWQAAALVWRSAGRPGEPEGRVRIAKRIPAQGGLGGGSANGATALVGWNRAWQAGLSDEELRRLALSLGADVPFFLVGGTALGLNRGDELQPLDDLPPRWVVLVFPPFGVSTPEAFRWWDADNGEAGTLLSADRDRAGSRRSSPPGGPGPKADRPWSAVFNDLEGPVTRRHPEIATIRRLLETSGAAAAAMTGSGSTVFGLFDSQPAASAASGVLERSGWRTLVTRTATRDEARLF